MMNKKFLILFCGLSILCLVLSIAAHYQFPGNISQKQHSMANIATMSRNSMDWITQLKTRPQFKPHAQAKSQTEVVVEQGMQHARLIGIVLDTRMLAIVTDPISNKVHRIGLGEDWLDSWVLEKIEADHVIWHNEQTDEQYIQALFKSSREDKSFLSSLNGN
jgi:hypothetical protein